MEEVRMKKIIALVMTVVLLLGAAAAAESTERRVISWADYEEEASNIEGSFGTISAANLMIFVPAGWEDVQLTDEQTSGGTFLVLRNAGVEETDPSFCILNGQLLPVDIGVFKSMIQQTSPLSMEDVMLNSAEVTVYEVIDANGIGARGVAYSTVDGSRTLNFGFGPVTEANENLVSLMIASLQFPQE